jgi:hypothetical protein
MIWILAFLVVYVMAAVWDVGRINRLFAKIAEPGPRIPTAELRPAPRLVISAPRKVAHRSRGTSLSS